jgi:hypothetical protein
MTAMTATQAKAIDEAIQAALMTVGTKFGVQFSVKKFRYNSFTGTAQIGIDLCPIASTGEVVTRESVSLKKMLQYTSFGNLTKDTVNETFMMGGRGYKVIGYNARCYARPFIIQDVKTGKTFKAPELSIKTAVKAA